MAHSTANSDTYVLSHRPSFKIKPKQPSLYHQGSHGSSVSSRNILRSPTISSQTPSNIFSDSDNFPNSASSSASHTTSSDAEYADIKDEWVQCIECDTKRTVWYNKDSLMVTFEDPFLSNMNRINRNESILKESIAREDIEDDAIPNYLLRFGSQKWDFRNDYVSVYRAQSARIDHTQCLPPARDSKFPEFFSNHTIPKKDTFICTILPPIDFKITTVSWKMSINVNKTTASDIIEKFVSKYSPREFVLKVIGNEEYILYDHTKLIIDYEAVRRAVRNEDDVLFGLMHRPDFEDIIKDAMEIQEDYKKSFDTKYPQKVRDLNFLKYEQFGVGDGKSLTEMKWEKEQIIKQKQKIQESTTSHSQFPPFTRNNQPQPPPPQQQQQQYHTQNNYNHGLNHVQSQSQQVISFNAYTNNNNNNYNGHNHSSQYTNNAYSYHQQNSVNSGYNNYGHYGNNQSALQQMAKQNQSMSQRHIPIHIPPKSKKLPINPPPHQQQHMHNNNGNMNNGLMPSRSLPSKTLSKALPALPHKISKAKSAINFEINERMNPHRKATSSTTQLNGHNVESSPHRQSMSMNNLNNFYKRGSLNNTEEESSSLCDVQPSLKDSVWLTNYVKAMNESNNYNVMLLEDHSMPYRVRISGLTNVTKLPRYIDKQNKLNPIKRIIVVHEVWMGSLSYNECKHSTPNIARVSDNMKFADWFETKSLLFSDLPREATISCTVYGLSEHEKKKDKVVKTPLAYVRLPIIDCRHRLINGKYVLNAWPIPVFKKTKHGLKSDPYSHGEEFRFRGPTRDRYIGRNSMKKRQRKTTSSSQKTHSKKPSSIADHFNKMEHDICQISIEFTRRDFDVVAPLISLKKPLQRNSNIFKPWHNEKHKKNTKKKKKKKNHDDWVQIHNIMNRELIHPITDEEKDLIWSNRADLSSMPTALPTFLRCVDWRKANYRQEAYELLRKWPDQQYAEDALELLGFEFADIRIREYAVMCIANMHDSDLQRYLLQLVQCLKYELNHNNALIRLLMRRALMNPYQIGHFLFWRLKSEYHKLEYMERFGLYMEEYLLHCTTHSRELLQQSNLMDALAFINNKIKKTKDKKQLHSMIEDLNRSIPAIISLPLNPRWRCTHLVVEKCRFFSSAQVPLLLIFKNVDPLADDISVLFKSGDDLRQDILTLQVFRVMDKVWLDRGLNLRLITYDVVATGNECGMIEIVLNSTTTNDVHVTEGGGPQKGCRDETTHLKWIEKQNLNKNKLDRAKYNYARSAAGYCVATYVLGIGDRHPDNIMLRQNGVIFHIDFGHFLGNFKVKKVMANYSWKRERSPFVFLPAMKHVMESCDLYNDFEQWFIDSYLALRIRHRLLFNLFTLMIPSVMPELICRGDLQYLQQQLHLSDISQDKIGKHCRKVIKQCLNDKSRILDNIFHAMKHS